MPTYERVLNQTTTISTKDSVNYLISGTRAVNLMRVTAAGAVLCSEDKSTVPHPGLRSHHVWTFWTSCRSQQWRQVFDSRPITGDSRMMTHSLFVVLYEWLCSPFCHGRSLLFPLSQTNANSKLDANTGSYPFLLITPIYSTNYLTYQLIEFLLEPC